MGRRVRWTEIPLKLHAAKITELLVYWHLPTPFLGVEITNNISDTKNVHDNDNNMRSVVMITIQQILILEGKYSVTCLMLLNNR